MTNQLDSASLYQIIDHLELGIVILNSEQRVLHGNRWLAERSGRSDTPFCDRLFGEIFPESSGTRLEQAIRHAIHDRLPSLLSPALHGTLLPLYRTPEDRHLERRMQQMIHVLPLGDTSAASCLIQISDVTANISRERLLRQQTENLRRTTTQDALTGAANRHQFDETLGTEFRKARNNRHPLGLMIVDIDRFSTYNTQFGRNEGDTSLRKIAAMLIDAVRPGIDLVARYGGDKFALILPGMSVKEVCQLAEALRSRISTLAMTTSATGIARYLTVSIGTSVMQPEGEADTHTLLSSADVALYQAKHDGRDRAIYFSPAEGSFKPCA